MLGEEHKLDGLATGMAEGTISRGRAIKLAGAALLGSALSLFLVEDAADAANLRQRRRRCERRGPNKVFCKGRQGSRCCNADLTTKSRCAKGRCGGMAPD
jgi:hypothetical protein